MNRLGLTIIAATCIPFWMLVGYAVAHAQPRWLSDINTFENHIAKRICVETAWAKERALNRLGIASQVVAVSVPNHIEGHAVLKVWTMDGEWWLDNGVAESQPVRWSMLVHDGYKLTPTGS